MAWRPFTRANLGWFIALCAALASRSAQARQRRRVSAGGVFDPRPDRRGSKPLHAVHRDLRAGRDGGSLQLAAAARAPLLVYFGFRVCARDSSPSACTTPWSWRSASRCCSTQFRLHYFGFFGSRDGRSAARRRAAGAPRLASRLTFVADVRRHRRSPTSPRSANVCSSSTRRAPTPNTRAASPSSSSSQTLCAEDPGVVLASADDGSAILFHSECSVIANNFILREPDKAHIDEIDRLCAYRPAEIRSQRPDVKYLFVRARISACSTATRRARRQEARSPAALHRRDAAARAITLIKTVRRLSGENGTRTASLRAPL